MDGLYGRDAFSVDESIYTTNENGDGTDLGFLEGWVSELRVWEVVDKPGRFMGVCVPEENQLIWGDIPAGRFARRWSSFLTQQMGPHLGESDSALKYPLAFDAGPDGRIYVIDAGSSRIVVFDGEGEYVMQWGGRGSGPGEFDFGSGINLFKGRDLHGSIYVDDEGFVYVADPGNRRIQKFAP